MKNIIKSIFGLNRYDSAKPSPTRNKTVGVADASAELSADALDRITAAVRDLHANFGEMRAAVNANDIYSVGDGITAQASSTSAEWNAAAEKLFETWARFADVRGRYDLGALTSLVCRALDVDGEIYAIFVRAGNERLPKIWLRPANEAARGFDDSARGIKQGIRFDRFGTPQEYFFGDGEARESFPAAVVVHVFSPEAVDSIHGLPQTQHAVNTMIDARELLSLMIVNGKLQNSLALKATGDRFAQGGAGAAVDLFGNGDAPAVSAEESAARAAALNMIIPGKIAALGEGESLESFTANAPAMDALAAQKELTKRAFTGILPPGFFLPNELTSGGIRFVTSQSARSFDRRQTDLIRYFLTPIWRKIIGSAIVSGRLPAVEDWISVEWNCPKSITIDAGREAAADRADVQAGLLPLADYYAARGKDWKKEKARVKAGLDDLAELGVLERIKN